MSRFACWDDDYQVVPVRDDAADELERWGCCLVRSKVRQQSRGPGPAAVVEIGGIVHLDFPVMPREHCSPRMSAYPGDVLIRRTQEARDRSAQLTQHVIPHAIYRLISDPNEPPMRTADDTFEACQVRLANENELRFWWGASASYARIDQEVGGGLICPAGEIVEITVDEFPSTPGSRLVVRYGDYIVKALRDPVGSPRILPCPREGWEFLTYELEPSP